MDLFTQAKDFLTTYYNERETLPGSETRIREKQQPQKHQPERVPVFEERLLSVRHEIEQTGSYRHTPDELEYGAKLAWRNSNKCIGRLFWKTLNVFDRRDVKNTEEMFDALQHHLRYAWNQGKIRSTITVFPQESVRWDRGLQGHVTRERGGVERDENQPESTKKGAQFRIWNPKLVRYAGYRNEASGDVIGDPEEVEFTSVCRSLGWKGQKSRFDILPLILESPGETPRLVELPEDCKKEVELDHPEFPWFRALGLRWYAIPVISNMILKIGGIRYPAAPFNGWFMGSEIGARNLGDSQRYNMLPVIAKKMGLNTRSKESLWKDRALLELNRAVLYSFRRAGVQLIDHHTASKQFMRFCANERDAGREVMADWSWIVPPVSGSATEVFHHHWKDEVVDPNFYHPDEI